MNVRIVCPEFTSIGGTPAAIWQLARFLRYRGHSLRVLSFSSDAMPDVEIQKIPDPMFSGFSRLLAMRRSARRDARAGERRYATGPDDPEANVVTFHACAQWRIRELQKGRVRFSGRSFRDLLRPHYLRAYLSASAVLERRIVERAAAGKTSLTAVSATLADQLRSAYAEDVPIEITPNGVDCAVYSPSAVAALRVAARSRFGFTNDDFVVGFVGGDWHRKNLKTFIHAVRTLRRTNSRIKAVVVGQGEPRAFAEDLPNGGIEFAGVSRKPIELYAAMDVFYSPSPVESFGLPALEAAACGIPIVICAGVGLLDFLEAGEAIVLSDPFDSDASSATLTQLQEDGALRERLSVAGVRAAERLPWSRGAQAIEQLLSPTG